MDNLIHQERVEIIRTNNSAQETLEEILENLKPSITELTIQTPLYGNLDLVAAVGDRFPQLKTIRFSAGKITEVRNIPVGVTRFECPGNLLVDLERLPGSLLVLNISDNYLGVLDLVGAPHLEELWCINNRIEEIKNLPRSLKRLYCGQNPLRMLDLRGLSNLAVLHCPQNPVLRIKHLPANIHEFHADNSPFALEMDDGDSDSEVEAEVESEANTEVEAKLVERRIEYIDALDTYFEAKHKYEEALLKRRRVAYQRAPTRKMGRRAAEAVKPNCVYCNRPVGTRFYTNSVGHFAVCGDQIAPCGLNVKLVRGSFTMKERMLYMFKEEMDEGKEKIIRHKLDTLFEYQSDEVAVRKFKQVLEDFTTASQVFEEYQIPNRTRIQTYSTNR